jgi:hypothetical protein
VCRVCNSEFDSWGACGRVMNAFEKLDGVPTKRRFLDTNSENLFLWDVTCII